MRQGMKNGPPPTKMKARTNNKIIEFSDFSSQGNTSSMKENSLLSDYNANLNSFEQKNEIFLKNKKKNSQIEHKSNRLRERFLKGLTLLDIFSKRKNVSYKKIFLALVIKHTEEQIELLNNFVDISKYESLKLFLRKFFNVLQLNLRKSYLNFFRNFITHERYVTIKKKKSFIYFHKLLVWRNKIIDYENFYTMVGLVKKIYFYNWARFLQYETIKIGKIRHRIKSIFHKVEVVSRNKNQNLRKVIFDLLLRRRRSFDSHNDFILKKAKHFVTKLQNYLDTKQSERKRVLFTRYFIARYENNRFVNYDLNIIRSHLNQSFNGEMKNPKINNILSTLLIYHLNLKRSSFDKSYLNSFRKWKQGNNLRNNLNLIENARKLKTIAILSNLNRTLFNKVRGIFINLMELIQIKTLMKLNSRNIQKYLLYLENRYNNILLKSCRGYYTLYSLIQKRNIFLFNISSRKMCSYLQNYFSIWKYKCIRISNEKKRSNTFYNGLVILKKISSVFTQANKKFTLDRIKGYKDLIRDSCLKGREFTSSLNLFIFKRYLLSDKNHFLNVMKVMHMTELGYNKLKVVNRDIIFQRQIKYLVETVFIRKNLSAFFTKLKINSSSDKINKMIRLSLMTEFLSKKILKTQCTPFYVKLKKLRSMSRNSIDKLTIVNIASVSVCMQETIIKKTKLVKSVKLLSQIHKFYVRKLNGLEKKLLYKHFNIWKKQIIYDNNAVIQEINTFEELHEDLKLKIQEYTEANENLELKLQEITLRGEQCQLCSQYVEEPSESNLIETQMTMNSIKDEEMNLKKIIPRTSITMNNNPMKEEQPSPFARISREELSNLRKSVRENKEEINSMLQKSSSINTSNLFDKDDNFIIDEKQGGVEYLNYLQKMSNDLQGKLKSLDNEYSPKCSQLLDEIEQLCIEIGYHLE